MKKILIVLVLSLICSEVFSREIYSLTVKKGTVAGATLEDMVKTYELIATDDAEAVSKMISSGRAIILKEGTTIYDDGLASGSGYFHGLGGSKKEGETLYFKVRVKGEIDEYFILETQINWPEDKQK